MRKHKIAVALAWVVFFTYARGATGASDAEQMASIPIEWYAPEGYLPDWYKPGDDIPYFSPNDPYFEYDEPEGFPGQWHLFNDPRSGGGPDANLTGAWVDWTGDGVTIGIVDDGLQRLHPDLSGNYVAGDSWDFTGQGDPDPSPVGAGDNHGTAVSGVAAARGGNVIGVTGAAPYAGLAGLRIEYGGTDQMFADATVYHSSGENTNIKIKNHSYGKAAPYIPDTVQVAALVDSADAGTIHVFAAGNDRVWHGYWDGYPIDGDPNKKHKQRVPESITVAALAEDGTFASYSNWGANVFVTAPSSGAAGFDITTTDRTGADGYNSVAGGGDGDPFPDLDYTSTFSRTSAAAPLVSGVMALGKEAYEDMDVRAAKHLLARTAAMVDPDDGDPRGGWVTNAAGYHFNNNYGFGLIDADAFTSMAALVEGLTEPATQETGPVLVTEPFGGALGTPNELTETFDFNTCGLLEDVEVYLSITHTWRGDVEAYLTSPGGTTSRLMTRNRVDYYDDIAWTFVSNAFWGEDPLGTWELRVLDTTARSDNGTWNGYAVTANMGNLDVTAEWKLATGDSYNDSANWTDRSVPNAVDAEANFLEKIEENSEVRVDSPVTVGTINFDNADYDYTIAGPATLTLETSSGDAQINVEKGDHTISARLSIPGGLTVDTADATGLSLSPASGNSVLEGNLTKDGPGSLVLGSRLMVAGELDYNGGDLEIASGVLVMPGGDVNIGAGLNLVVSGDVNRRVTGADDSRITVGGPTSIGVLGDTDGYNFAGLLDVGPHSVGLVDADLAHLGGAKLVTPDPLPPEEGGTLSSFAGIRVLPFSPPNLDTAVTGEGHIIGLVVGSFDDPEVHPALFLGSGDGIKITGVLRGRTTTVNVDLSDCLFQPGFSPVFSRIGSPATMGSTLIQIEGPTHGKVIDPDLVSGLIPGDYTQFYAFRGRDRFTIEDLDPEIKVVGPFKLDLTANYVPAAGTEFLLIQTGPLRYPDGSLLDPAILTYDGVPTLDTALAPLPRGMDWVVSEYSEKAFMVKAVRDMVTAVPEPGTLVMLGTGGLGLLLLVWRRRKPEA